EARAYAGLHQYDRAISSLEEILKKDPLNSQALNAVAEAYEKVGASDKAVATYKQLVEQQGSMIALQNYARHMVRLGKADQIQPYIDDLQKQGKLTDKYNEVLGEIYLNLKEYDKSKNALTKAIEKNPESFRSYLLMANLIEVQGDKAGALSFLENSAERFHQPEFMIQLGLLYHKNEQPQKEGDTFARMVQINKRDPRGYFYLAKSLLDRGGPFDKVLELAQTGLELKPDTDFQIFGNYLVAD